MQQKTHTHTQTHTHTHTQTRTHTPWLPTLTTRLTAAGPFHAQTKKKSGWSIEARGEKKEAVTEREREQHWWFVMRSPQQHVPASSTTKKKKPWTHTDELQTASISSIRKHNRLQSKTVVSDVGVASTGGVSTLLHHRSASRRSRQLSAPCMWCFFYYSGEEMTTWAEGREADLQFSASVWFLTLNHKISPSSSSSVIQVSKSPEIPSWFEKTSSSPVYKPKSSL